MTTTVFEQSLHVDPMVLTPEVLLFSHSEAAAFLAKVGIKPLTKDMPTARLISQHEADQRHAAQLVSREILSRLLVVKRWKQSYRRRTIGEPARPRTLEVPRGAGHRRWHRLRLAERGAPLWRFKILLRVGLIEELRWHVPYALHVGNPTTGERTRSAYVADFTYRRPAAPSSWKTAAVPDADVSLEAQTSGGRARD